MLLPNSHGWKMVFQQWKTRLGIMKRTWFRQNGTCYCLQYGIQSVQWCAIMAGDRQWNETTHDLFFLIAYPRTLLFRIQTIKLRCQSHQYDFVVQNVSSQNGAGGFRRAYRGSPCLLRDAPVNGGSGHGFSSFFSNHSSSPSLESESFLGSYKYHHSVSRNSFNKLYYISFNGRFPIKKCKRSHPWKN